MVFVEASRQVALTIKENIKKLGFSDRAKVINARAEKALREFIANGEKFDFVFADPPYKLQQLEQLTELVADVIEDEGLFVLEMHKKTPAPITRRLKLWKEARIGDTILRFYIRDIPGDI